MVLGKGNIYLARLLRTWYEKIVFFFGMAPSDSIVFTTVLFSFPLFLPVSHHTFGVTPVTSATSDSSRGGDHSANHPVFGKTVVQRQLEMDGKPSAQRPSIA